MTGPSLRAKMFLQVLRKARHGTVEVLFPDGVCDHFGEGDPRIRVEVRRWDALELLFRKGDMGLAEAILDEWLVVDDVAALIEWACRNDRDLEQLIRGSWYGNLLSKLHHALNWNTPSGAKKNIMAHYDLGNEFYRLWLDPSMTYSSALFATPGADLHAAQLAKYDRIIEALQIKPGDHVLEIGCGWGGFFSRAVERTGCKVTAVMNSPQQARHNRQVIDEKGLGSHIDLRQLDYRQIEGRYDKVVSIEMIEAVGERYWSSYFGKVKASLRDRGAALIQGITIREDLFYSYRSGTDFIQQLVFPGGMLLTTSEIRRQGGRQGLGVEDVFEFGASYAETLRQWRENFRMVGPRVREMGFDDRFIRLWNLYLSYCEGAFRARRINVGQYLLTT